jgi:hypothetical protein
MYLIFDIVLTSPPDLATDVLENIFLLVPLSNNEVDVIKSKDGARHGGGCMRRLMPIGYPFSAGHVQS